MENNFLIFKPIHRILRMIEEPLFYMQMKENTRMKLNSNVISNKISNDQNENYKMVIVVRKDLKMGEGKIAAQVGHGGIIVNI